VKEDRIYLLHIRDALERILSYTAQGKQAFLADPRTQDAVIRNLEVVGEAVKNLSESLKARHATIPWKRIAGMRDKMIREYLGVNLQLVWDAIEQEVPSLQQKLEFILGEWDEASRSEDCDLRAEPATLVRPGPLLA
jgi:uncharacterized protein with HEPN domain